MRDVALRTVAGIESACARLRPGVRRLELFQAVREEILDQGVDDVGFGPDCWAIGPDLAVDWANARTRNANPVLAPPCSVSLDVGATLRGYRSDVGRTIFVGEAPPRSAEALGVLREARAVAAPLLASGRRAREVDDATRALIAERGFGPGQWIPSGHGIGLEFHEPPVLGENDETVLLDGAAVTFELAIWMDGDAGAFAEDTVVVRDGGPGMADRRWRRSLDDRLTPQAAAPEARGRAARSATRQAPLAGRWPLGEPPRRSRGCGGPARGSPAALGLRAAPRRDRGGRRTTTR